MDGPPKEVGKHFRAVACGLLFLMLLMFWLEVLHVQVQEPKKLFCVQHADAAGHCSDRHAPCAIRHIHL